MRPYALICTRMPPFAAQFIERLSFDDVLFYNPPALHPSLLRQQTRIRHRSRLQYLQHTLTSTSVRVHVHIYV